MLKAGKMKIKMIRKAILALVVIILIPFIACSITPAAASVGLGLSPSSVNLGVIGRGGTGTGTVSIYNTGNSSALNYTATPEGVNITVNPSNGTIPAKGNATLTLTANVPDNATQGSYNGSLLIKATASGGNTSATTVLPALAAKVTFDVEGTATPTPAAASGLSAPLAAVLIVLAAVLVILVVYFLVSRRHV
jgi:hypothetical protein